MTRGLIIRWFLAELLTFTSLAGTSQRLYSSNSVLASGTWYKIAVSEPGVYKIDIPFLKALGINQGTINSSAVRIFGNGGGMLPEACNGAKIEDLQEIAIGVEDGGDGSLDGQDYLIFYAEGPHKWIPDRINKNFSHQKNLFSEKSFFFLSIDGQGKRVRSASVQQSPTTTVTTFDDRIFYELDTINFLSSGKEWYGEEFSTGPGKSLNKSFFYSIPNVPNGPVKLVAHCLARTFGGGSKFNFTINGQPALQLDIPAVGTGPYDQFARELMNTGSTITSSPLTVGIEYTPGGFGSQGWLDWFEIFSNRNLSVRSVDQLLFRDWQSVGSGNIAKFVIQDATPSMQVWDVTDPFDSRKMDGIFSGTEFQFVNDCSILHEYVAFNNKGFLTPVSIGRVENQNLHNSFPSDIILITHPSLLAQAQRLAQYHEQRDQLRTSVVTTEQVFNEFSSGTPDPSAIRDYVKMHFDKAGSDTSKRPKYLLLFGDASFDYKSRINNNTNLVPAFESKNSLDPLSSFTSDDFFGLLKDSDDINGSNANTLDIGIGRLPAKNEHEAKSIVDKIVHYTSSDCFGPWRNDLTFVADDEDANLHLQDAESIVNSIPVIDSIFNADKIYLDAFKQESGSGGSRYPQVNVAITNRIFNGTLIWNYNGHGGYRRLAEEVVLDEDIINSFNNGNRLPLFLTATCDVAPFDNPLVNSIGENLLLRERTGAIALMTTTRLVFAFSNRVMNQKYLDMALQKNADKYLTLGEAVKSAKNNTIISSGDVINNRKFTLLGDPALRLAFPVFKISITGINGVPIAVVPDTLKALSKYTIEGEVTDVAGNRLSDFSGTVFPTVFDKMETVTTLGNDPGSIITPFQQRKNILFKGKAKVSQGQFSYTFVVPKDINYQFGYGRISLYANNSNVDGNGTFKNIIIGGSGNSSGDKDGPAIKIFLNDEKFITGGITNNHPTLLARLTDSSGINVMGTNIGHDLVAMIDNDPKKNFVLNEFYESELDDYRKGVVRFQLPELQEGWHTLTIKAWDVANNSNEATIDFRVTKDEQFSLDHVLNYPNPFTTRTTFWFGHNRPGEELWVDIRIFTITGKLVKTLRSTIISMGNRSSDVEWDGRDDYGKKIGRGVYIYRLRVQTTDGKVAQKIEKLFLL